MINFSIENRIAIIELNREEKRNALSPTLVEAIKEALKKVEEDASIRVLIFKGKGKAFSAGADLAYLQTLQNNTFEENLEDSNSLKDMFLAIHQCSKITIAQVEGAALAGGCGLATVCDFIFATPESTFGYTEVKIGFIPAIVSYFLSRKLGEGKAKNWLLTGVIQPAAIAKQDGLINEIVSSEVINETVLNFAHNIASQTSGEAITLTKKLMDEMQNKSLKDALELTATFNANARASEDCKKGIAAFLNKEKNKW